MVVVSLLSLTVSSSGYLAPEYAMRGHMTEKVDVFAFGVVALEIVAGESNYQNTFDENTTYIFERVRSVYLLLNPTHSLVFHCMSGILNMHSQGICVFSVFLLC